MTDLLPRISAGRLAAMPFAAIVQALRYVDMNYITYCEWYMAIVYRTDIPAAALI